VGSFAAIVVPALARLHVQPRRLRHELAPTVLLAADAASSFDSGV